MKEVSYLAEWLVRYLKNKDIFFKRIKGITQEESIIKIEYKDRSVEVHVLGFDSDPCELTKSFDPDKNHGLALYNTEDNLKLILSCWKELAKIKGLIVYFVNPFSKLDKQWIIYPHTHDKISDAESLEMGLRSMFSGVEPTTKKEILEIVR